MSRYVQLLEKTVEASQQIINELVAENHQLKVMLDDAASRTSPQEQYHGAKG